MPDLEFGCLPTMIGSMPHRDPDRACADVTRYLKDIPAWPQLPERSFLENMYVQYSEGFPGIVVDTEAERVFVDRAADSSAALERLYTAYLEKATDKFAISREYAAGLYAYLEMEHLKGEKHNSCN